jgi:glycine C-acetyltransferase
MTERFRRGLADLGLETLAGEHPVVPLMARDTERTSRIVGYAQSGHSPRGSTTLWYRRTTRRSASRSRPITAADIDEALAVLRRLLG